MLGRPKAIGASAVSLFEPRAVALDRYRRRSARLFSASRWAAMRRAGERC
eukprot:CAMPEP_0176286342 /NCGR_PEP_ID=MMETSP0121_2-20121125/52854_1 /TAXON_ID=160619 /ORGANISM="Kryptoperidinium foliaceum, Strain CCMP 1326" /LENGTH=49 /DNA_ID= /DNA_START= /DNA_END= /DNA_ORIENTATION=